MLLFDTLGGIAGIQTTVPKSTGYPTKMHKSFHNVWVDDAAQSTITAYFVDPAIICSSGRSKYQISKEGTGDRLVIQVGPPTSRRHVKVLIVAE